MPYQFTEVGTALLAEVRSFLEDVVFPLSLIHI